LRRLFYPDIDLVGKAPPPLPIAGIRNVIPVRYRLSNVAGRIRRPIGYVLVRHLRVAVQRTPGGHVDPSVRTDESVLSVLRRMVGVNLHQGAAVQIQGVSWKDGQKIETRRESRKQIVSGCGGGR